MRGSQALSASRLFRIRKSGPWLLAYGRNLSSSMRSVSGLEGHKESTARIVVRNYALACVQFSQHITKIIHPVPIYDHFRGEPRGEPVLCCLNVGDNAEIVDEQEVRLRNEFVIYCRWLLRGRTTESPSDLPSFTNLMKYFLAMVVLSLGQRL